MPPDDSRNETWPSLPLDSWSDTCATLHMWAQIVGKIRLARNPWVNHSWHATLYLTSRGLTTTPIPDRARNRTFQIDFDFLSHELAIQASDGRTSTLPLEPQSVAYPAFYSYAYPEPAGFSQAPVRPDAAFYSADLREFILAYDIVRASASPDETLLDFLQATYEAAANLAHWDRGSLERGHDPKSTVHA
ncbi:MAG: DUF5996 family protein [Candidatus Acidiferrales bacterium]